MHVLLIGGNRFVGPLLGWRLLAGGHRVTLLNRGHHPDPFGGRVERLVGDRTGDLAALLGGRSFDAVVDFVAFTGADGAQAAAALAGRCGHYVLISTGQVYLVREGAPRPATEADYDGPVMPRPEGPYDQGQWDYGAGKRACEEALLAAAGFPATRVRIPMVNGERDPQRRLERYLWRLLDGGPVLLPDGGPHPVRHVYAGEVARFVASILGRPETFGQAYNVAQQETPTLAELVGLLAGLLGSRAEVIGVPAERLRAAGLDPLALSPFSSRWMSFIDPGRAARELGFTHLPLAEYLGRIVACHLAVPPADPPPGAEGREVERRVERELLRGR